MGGHNVPRKSRRNHISRIRNTTITEDGNCFLHAARFALLQRNDWNITVVPMVVQIREDVTRFLTNAHMHVIWDGRTLDGVRGDMIDPVTVGSRRTPRLEHYDSWSK